MTVLGERIANVVGSVVGAVLDTAPHHRQLVAWCPEHHWWLPESEVGKWCDGDDHETRFGTPLMGKRKLVKRRAILCDYDDGVTGHPCEMAFFKRSEFDLHVRENLHYDAY